MSSFGSASRRAVLRTPAVLWFLVATIGMALVVMAPSEAGATVTGPVDLDGGQELDDSRDASIGGVVVTTTGRRHLGAIVKLDRTDVDGQPGAESRPAYTGVDGRYRFDDLSPGCYRITVEAPAGTSFEGGATSDEQTICVEAGQAVLGVRSVVVASGADPSADRTIEIVHLGHHLGRLAPSTERLDLAGTTVEAEIGGLARVVTAIAAARPVGSPESTVTVNTGGLLAGSAMAHLFGGAADADLLNRVCFDFVAPSPEDLARADDWMGFVRYLDQDRCGTVVLDPDGPNRPGATPDDPAVAMHAVGDGVVAFVAVTPGSGAGPSDPIEATAARVDRLTDAGVSSIVLLSGLGLAADRELVADLPAVDAIVGSGPGSILGDLDDVGIATGGPYPDRVANADGEPVCLGHAGHRARAVGVLEVEIDADGRVVGCGGRIEVLVGRWAPFADPTADDDGDAEGTSDADDREEDGEEDGEEDRDSGADGPAPTPADIDRAIATHPELTVVEPDLATTRSLTRWSDVADLLLDDPVATVTNDLCQTRVPGRSVGLLCGVDGHVTDTTAPRADAQRLVADALRHAADELGSTAIALIDSDTVSGPIGSGPLSLVEAYRLLPIGPTLSVAEVSGSELAAIVREQVEAALDGAPGAYPHGSGLRFRPDLARTNRPRVGPIEVLDDLGRWQTLDPEARYRVVFLDRLVDGERSPTLNEVAEEGRITPTTIGPASALLDYVGETLGGVVGPPPSPDDPID